MNTDNENFVPLLKEIKDYCTACNRRLCIRQQVLNLALGYLENEIFCLSCLAIKLDRSREEVLGTLIPYINERECFLKTWQKYKDISFCPDQITCIPNSCFPK